MHLFVNIKVIINKKTRLRCLLCLKFNAKLHKYTFTENSFKQNYIMPYLVTAERNFLFFHKTENNNKNITY